MKVIILILGESHIMSQIDICNDLVRNKNWQIIETCYYASFETIIERAKNLSFDFLLVSDFSRIGTLEDNIKFNNSLKLYGVKIYSALQDIIFDDYIPHAKKIFNPFPKVNNFQNLKYLNSSKDLNIHKIWFMKDPLFLIIDKLSILSLMSLVRAFPWIREKVGSIHKIIWNKILPNIKEYIDIYKYLDFLSGDKIEDIICGRKETGEEIREDIEGIIFIKNGKFQESSFSKIWEYLNIYDLANNEMKGSVNILHRFKHQIKETHPIEILLIDENKISDNLQRIYINENMIIIPNPIKLIKSL